MTLYNEQPIEKFTLDEIAAGAGTTVQTILRIFGSKEDLLLAALSEMVADGAALKVTPPGDIPAAVAAIIDVYETVGDVVIQRLNDERRYPALKTILDQGRQNHRNWVKTAFAPSIARQEGASARSCSTHWWPQPMSMSGSCYAATVALAGRPRKPLSEGSWKA